jgi:hypothetical protein
MYYPEPVDYTGMEAICHSQRVVAGYASYPLPWGKGSYMMMLTFDQAKKSEDERL